MPTTVTKKFALIVDNSNTAASLPNISNLRQDTTTNVRNILQPTIGDNADISQSYISPLLQNFQS